MTENRFDVIIIGGGHAGIEAAHAAALMGARTALLSMSLGTLGRPSCNPSIGGTAKGHLVKEIDALGGAMGLLADRAGIHFKMLNTSKGPAIWSPRAQIDKDLYPKYALSLLLRMERVTLVRGTAKEILIEKDKVKGIITDKGDTLFADAVILSAGTFLNGKMFTGGDVTYGGRVGEPAVSGLTEKLRSYGLVSGRLKTGTPPRISAESIDRGRTWLAPGDEHPLPFSRRTKEVKNVITCLQTETNREVHDILRTGFSRSPMFTGMISGVGPRYCPSIEDKVNRFAERQSHKILLEPEGLSTNSVYVNGYSTSLPVDVQIAGLRKISGLEHCEMLRPGYAIEYDFFHPWQINYNMETKAISGLFFAGQINGTSGYEEAASQGIMAGINAVLKTRGEAPFTLRRSEAYIGVLIDDLVNKNTEEPYRIFTSLAEYRLLLRQDNADLRLSKHAFELGLISSEDHEKVIEREYKIKEMISDVKSIKTAPAEVNEYLESVGESPVLEKTDFYYLTKRSGVNLKALLAISGDERAESPEWAKAIEQAQIEIKYEGYIERQRKEVEYFLENELKAIPADFDYNSLNSISTEAREKLQKVRPHSLGQASRIAGVSASDVSILSLFLK